MRKEYKEELEELKVKMEKAEKFAKKLPIFAEIILKGKFSGEENWGKYGSWYKDIYLGWDINRGHYKSDTSRYMTNRRGDPYDGYFFNIYINSCSLFDSHDNHGLYESLEDVDIFYTDTMNTTFYITDENIHAFLEALNDWYLKARELSVQEKAKKEIAKAEEQIERAKLKLEQI